MPFGGERSDNLVEHRDSQLGKFSRAGAVFSQNLAGQRENHEHTLKCRLLISVFGRQVLRSDPGQKLYIEFPRRGPVRVLRSKLAFEKGKLDLEAGQAPFLKEIAPLHRENLPFRAIPVKVAATRAYFANRRAGSALLPYSAIRGRNCEIAIMAS